MKRIFSLLTALVFVCALTACGEASTQSIPEQSQLIQSESQVGSVTSPSPQSTLPTSPAPGESEPTADGESRVLVAYFSATGNTERVANAIAEATGGDLFEITPADPYTDDDLNWTDENSRVVQEYENPDARDTELVAYTPENWADYDVVYIGYPIWWGIAAWPVDGFVEANDFTGKTVIPFCTSSSSGLGQSGELLSELAGTGDWQEGQRFRSSASQEDVSEWVDSLGLSAS